MSNRPIIRDAERRDIPEITSIYAIQVREGLASFELQPPSEAEMAHSVFATSKRWGYPILWPKWSSALPATPTPHITDPDLPIAIRWRIRFMWPHGHNSEVSGACCWPSSLNDARRWESVK